MVPPQPGLEGYPWFGVRWKVTQTDENLMLADTTCVCSRGGKKPLQEAPHLHRCVAFPCEEALTECPRQNPGDILSELSGIGWEAETLAPWEPEKVQQKGEKIKLGEERRELTQMKSSDCPQQEKGQQQGALHAYCVVTETQLHFPSSRMSCVSARCLSQNRDTLFVYLVARKGKLEDFLLPW